MEKKAGTKKILWAYGPAIVIFILVIAGWIHYIHTKPAQSPPQKTTLVAIAKAKEEINHTIYIWCIDTSKSMGTLRRTIEKLEKVSAPPDEIIKAKEAFNTLAFYYNQEAPSIKGIPQKIKPYKLE